jgi:hypothetical protein
VVVEPGSSLYVGGDDAPLPCLAAAIEGELETPYRAVGIRQEGSRWGVGAVSIEVAELPADTEGDELMLTVNQEGERALEIDGRPTAALIPELEAAAHGRYDAFFLRATRLDARLWEIGIDPL